MGDFLGKKGFASGLFGALHHNFLSSDPYLYYIILKINHDIVDQSFFCDDTTIVNINKIKLRLSTLDLNDENSSPYLVNPDILLSVTGK